MNNAFPRLLKVLSLERQLGYRNKAVIGGLDKFASRFGYVERRLRERGVDLHAATLAAMDALWEEAKQHGDGADGA